MATTDGHIWRTTQREVQTFDATVTTIWSYTAPDETDIFIRAVVQARRNASTDAATYELTGALKRESAGSVTQITGSPSQDHVYEDAGLAACEATIDGSGNDVRVRVTGVAATQIFWRAAIEIITFYKP